MATDVLTFQLFAYPTPQLNDGAQAPICKEREDRKLYY